VDDVGGELDLVRLRDAIDALREGIQILSPEWRYLYLNEAAARHGRATREALLGKTMLECYPGIEATNVFAVLDRCMRERCAESLENEFEYEDGQRAWFELRVEPCPEGVIVLSLDITDRKHLEASLVQGEKLRALGQLAAGVAHDLRNICNPISLNVRLLRKEVTDHSDADALLERVEEALRAAHDTVDQLRSFSRQEPERSPELADLNRLTDAALAICHPRIRMHPGIGVVREVGEAPAVLVRGSELVNAVMNLVVNALDAIESKGTITVRTGCDEEGAFVEVADDGPGMPPEAELHAFEPFFTTKEEGTGLGLAMVYAFAERHGGHVVLRTAAGSGTSVQLRFPRPEGASPSTPVDRAPDKGAGDRRRLLVVEDEPMAREALAMLLVEEGYTVEAAESGEVALDRLAEFEPDALLVDFHLPGINGATVVQKARGWRDTLSIVLLTGRDPTEEGMVTLLRDSRTAHVGKPIDLGKLLAELERLLGAER
jgi:PAS domain S-box-containing protein